MSASGPGCVKTSIRGECAELFSLFSSFDDACQSGYLLIQRNRDKSSTRKFEPGVFKQPGSKGEILAASRCFPLWPQQRTSLDRVGMSVRCRYCCKSRKSNNPKNLAKVDLRSSLLLHRLSAPL